MTRSEISNLLEKFGNQPLELLRALGGYYECPKTADGKRLGPLVAYAAKYPHSDGNMRNFVGDIYANFAILEQYPAILQHLTRILASNNLSILMSAEVFAGPQMGGIATANMLAFIRGVQLCYVEKEVKKLGTDTEKEESEMKVLRHSFPEGSQVVIVEDVLNNFSTTKKTIKAVEDAGGRVIGITGLLNRSSTIKNEFDCEGKKIPVCALINMEIKQYEQNDPEVIADIEANNLVLSPKKEWAILKAAMENAKAVA
jgi:orotate phosphoribosyltransferase